MTGPSTPDDESDDATAPRVAGAWRGNLLVVAAAAVVLAAGGWLLPPADVALPPTSVLNVLFDHVWIVGAVRFAAVISILFLVASIWARASAGQWIRRVGPVDATADVDVVTKDGDAVQQKLDEAEATVAHLRGQLEAAMALLDEVADTPPRGGGASGDHDGGAGWTSS